MIKGVTHAHLGPIWYHSEPSDVPYSPNQFLDLDFFVASYSKIALVSQSVWSKKDMINFEPKLAIPATVGCGGSPAI